MQLLLRVALIVSLIFALLGSLSGTAWAKLTDSMKTGHPRLLASAGTWAEIQQRRQADSLFAQFLQQSEAEARAILEQTISVYDKRGRRLLHVSRNVLQRVLVLSLHYRLTGDKALLARAEQEMLAVAAFQDWNPSHFLDTAEMTAALGFGYDWLFDALSENSRATIRTAIVNKGLRPGLDPNSPYRLWHTSTNNWNSVCMGGLTLGALAIADEEPELAERMVELVKRNNAIGMKAYAPEGVYPEGPMYWSYGTSYQVILLAALESALGTDFGISGSPGFMESGAAYVQTTAPSGKPFNFFDGMESMGIEPALFWFARKQQQAELLQFQWPKLEKYASQTTVGGESGRFLPLAALWWPERKAAGTKPLPQYWYGRSENPIAVFRSSWTNPNAIYLAFKGGRAQLSHGHMDAGSFVFEADGVRWARDLGHQEYHSLESKGINMWDSKQEGQRWQVFRLNNFSHNTLTIDGQLHRVNGQAEIGNFIPSKDGITATVDLTQTFGNQVTKATRTFQMRHIFITRHVHIFDELEGLKPGTTVRWTMATGAEITLNGNSAILKQDGKQLDVGLSPWTGAKFAIASADYTADGFNAPNPGIQLLVADIKVPESGKLQISVMLRPNSQTAP